MSTPTEPRPEHPNTYFVQDRSSGEEFRRLQVQDRLLTNGMGGVLPEHTDPTSLHTILDVGCGIGAWLIDTATAYPNITRLVGVDISTRMLEYARSQAEAAGVADRIEFGMMDALRMLEFPDHTFDLVNQRFGQSYLRTWDWPKLLSEYRRVLRKNGTVRITESNFVFDCKSPALVHLSEMDLVAFHLAGHTFTPTTDGVTGALPRLLRQSGFRNIQSAQYKPHFYAGTPECQHVCEDMAHLYHVIKPFLQKWGQLPNDYETIYQQALTEMSQPDFEFTWTLSTSWGTI